MQHYTNTLYDTFGNAISGATVYVYAAGTTTASTIYSDNISTSTTNPLTTGSDGSFDFYAANGRYDLAITHPGYTFSSTDTAGIVLFELTGYTSTKAAPSGYTRIGPNCCIPTTAVTANWTPSLTYAGHVIDARIPDGNYVLLTLHFTAKSNNAVAARKMNTVFGRSVGDLSTVHESFFGTYEYVGVTPGTVIAQGEETVLLPVSGTGKVYATDIAIEADGNAYIDLVSIVCIFD